MLLCLLALTSVTLCVQGSSLKIRMAKCSCDISGKRFKWTIPPGHTKDSSKKFLFWDVRTKNLELDGEWEAIKIANERISKSRSSLFENSMNVFLYKVITKNIIF